ncbi:MAG: SPASM domain-containing protein [Chitinophagales bacterium]
MPHSACNCQCVMCDIWKGNKQLKQLGEEDIRGLLETLKKFHTREVVMSGGEAILNQNFFLFCEILKAQGIHVVLLSTGLTLERHAKSLLKWTSEIIVSLDGDEACHDRIRNIPGAFKKLKKGVQTINMLDPHFRITGRSVIHRSNFRYWASIVSAAKEIGLRQISFLPADVSSQAFNRPEPWNVERQHEIMLGMDDLDELLSVIQQLEILNAKDFESGFIAESPEKLHKIHEYYGAFYGLNPFPFKKCNAPWVSTVVEADGTVRPCFFHDAIGNIRSQSLESILNSENAVSFRRNLDMKTNSTCTHCVCSLYLPAWRNPV